MASSSDVEALHREAQRLQQLFKSGPARTITLDGRLPDFASPSWPFWGVSELDYPGLHAVIDTVITDNRQLYLRVYRETISRLASSEELGGSSDEETTRHTIALFERRWSAFMTALRGAIDQKLEAWPNVPQDDAHISSKGGFSTNTIIVLETAYARTQVLSQRECALLAQAANITHQQVRTWFQNKRNREARRQRVTSQPVLSTSQPTPAPVRRIVSLPKRGKKDVAINAPPPVPTHEPSRPVRQLPRRAAAANVASYFDNNSNDSSPSPPMSRTLSASSEHSILSSSSLTSLSSIHPTGGFASSLYPANSAGSTQVSFPIDLSPAASSAIGSSDPFLSDLEFRFGPSTPLEESVERLLVGVPYPVSAQHPGQPAGASAAPQWSSGELDHMLHTATDAPVPGAHTNGPTAMPSNEAGSPESTTSSSANTSTTSELSTSSNAQSSGDSQDGCLAAPCGQSLAPMGIEQLFGLGDDFFASLDTLLHSSRKDQPSGGLLAQAEQIASSTVETYAASSVAPEQTGLVIDTAFPNELDGQTDGPFYVTPELVDPSPSSVRSSTYLVTPEITSLSTDDLELNQFQQIFNLAMGATELPAIAAADPVMVPIHDLVSTALLDPAMIPLPQPTVDEAGCLGFEDIEQRDLQAAEQTSEGGVWDFSDLVNFE